MLLGVDRLTTPREFPRKLLAMETVARAKPAIPRKVRLADRSAVAGKRRRVQDSLRGEVEGLVGTHQRLECSLRGTRPIHYLYQPLPQENWSRATAADDIHGRDADAGRNNLVAKEYVAARTGTATAVGP